MVSFGVFQVPQCSLQHYLHQPRHGSSINVHRQMDKEDVYTHPRTHTHTHTIRHDSVIKKEWNNTIYSNIAERAMAPHSSTLAWQIPWTEEPGKLQSMRSLRVGHDWATSLPLSCIGEGNGNPLQCSCLENPRDGGAWWAAVYGVTQSRTRLKRLSSSSRSSIATEMNLDIITLSEVFISQT